MTLGTIIAAKRKELGLSQEALGQQLGVSRQAIYKWESDASLPEIDKLIAMSKLFGITVGALLGLEEEGQADPTEAQLAAVEAIVKQYLAAREEPSQAQLDALETMVDRRMAKKKGRWPRVLGLCALAIAFLLLLNRLDNLSRKYQDLSYAYSNLQYSVNNQVSNITNRMEEILKAQNNLAADYSAEYLSTDVPGNAVTFRVSALPRTYTDGLTVSFLAETGEGQCVQVEGMEEPGHRFSAEVTCPLSDQITLSAVFRDPGGDSSIQRLDGFFGMLSDTIPEVYPEDLSLWNQRVPDGRLVIADSWTEVSVADSRLKPTTGTVRELRLGLFHNRTLIAWGQEGEQPPSYQGDWSSYRFFRFTDVDVQLEPGDRIQLVAFFTDSFGREFASTGVGLEYQEDEGILEYITDGTYGISPVEQWQIPE